jgi:hypothetical protein
MKSYGGVDVQIHTLLTSALAGGEWSSSRPGSFIPWKRAPGTHWIEGWVDTRAGLDDVEKILDPTGTQNPNPSVVQPVVSRHTYCPIPAPRDYLIQNTILSSCLRHLLTQVQFTHANSICERYSSHAKMLILQN